MNRYTVTSIVSQIESYILKYVSFADPSYVLPLALWIVGTFIYPDFDCYPYLVITAATKRAGKSRLGEILSFCASNPRNFGAMTPAGLFYSLETEHPVIFFDEAETLGSEAASTMRAVLNMGYRKGQSVPRLVKGKLKEFPTYSPKVFILIGDVADTLRDRSIIVRMKRGEPKERFIFEVAKGEGDGLRTRIDALLKDGAYIDICSQYMSHRELSFLNDRDEEIWLPLFSIARLLCPHRIKELTQSAVDITTEKTAEAVRYVNLQGEERKADDDEYAKRLLIDVQSVLKSAGDHLGRMGSASIVEQLKTMPEAPWRKFRGSGLTIQNLADMLARFGVTPNYVRVGRNTDNVVRGYRLKHVEQAVQNSSHEAARK